MAFPTSPNTGDLYTVGTKTYRFDGTDWTKVGYFKGNLVSNSIVSFMIQDGAINSSKLNSSVTSFLATKFQNSQLGTITTTTVTEGNKLYFTNTRAISAVTAGVGVNVTANGMITHTGHVSNTVLSNYLGNVFGNITPNVNSSVDLGTGTRVIKNTFIGNSLILGNTILTTNAGGDLTIKNLNYFESSLTLSSNGQINTNAGSLIPITISNVVVTDSGFEPNDGNITTSGGYLRIYGTNFESDTTVLFNDKLASTVSVVGDYRLNVTVPSLTAGNYAIFVVNPDSDIAMHTTILNVA